MQLLRICAAKRHLTHPRAWLYRVAKNNCYNAMKRKNTFYRIIGDLHGSMDPHENVEVQFTENEEKQLIRTALQKMDFRDRTILQLYQDDLSYTEIAEILGIKKTSVGKTLSRAIEKCAKLIER